MEYQNKTYKEFAEKGTNGIAQLVGKNNAAEKLIHKLLSLHIDKIDVITSLIKQQNCSYSELFELLTAYPDQIKFNKQLFTHRENPAMSLCFLYCISAFKPITIPLFKSHFGLTEDPEYMDSMWMTMVESWYSALDVNNLTAKHMQNISEETAEIIFKLNKH